MKRFFASVLGLFLTLPTLFASPAAAVADSVTGTWTWTDISGQLTSRTNRPIWAVAYANGAWFYTDGQDLWNGGQVYRFDGFTQTNITVDVRNAGVNRVDDIVTDGETVLFLQDIVRLDNQLSVVTYRSGQYLNITSQVRGMLQWDEGVSSITGRAGEWMVVTTKARLFRLNNSGSATQITLPSLVRDNVPKDRALLYNVNHNANSDYIRLAMVPVGSNKWLLAASELGYQKTGSSLSNGAQIGHSLFYTYANGSFTEAAPGISTRQVHAVVSNGTQALVMMETLTATVSYADLYSFDGNNWKRGSRYAPCNDRGMVQPCINVSVARSLDISWNGRSWMLVNQNKEIYRIDPNLTWSNYGTARDYFVTVAGDGNGRFLLGGAEGSISWSVPTSPLTAKLVMVTEGVPAPQVLGSTTGFSSGRTFTSANGPQTVTQGNPSNFRIGNGKTFAYRVTASDPNGVNRIDIYVNDAIVRTCLGQDTCEFRADYWTNGDTTRTVRFAARATDNFGNITLTSYSADTLTVDLYGTGTADGQVLGNTDTSGSVWTWLDPNQTTLNANQSVRFRANASDADGLDRIEIFVNGGVVRTCTFGGVTGTRDCDATIYANNYTQGTNVFVNAKATDRYGNSTWSNSTTLLRANDSTSTDPQTNNGSRPDVWDWLEGNDERITGAESVEYRVGAWDEQGIERIEVVANGSVRRTCTFDSGTVSRECVSRFYADSYPAGTDIFVNAKVTDRAGDVTWTTDKTIRVGQSTSGSTSNNGNATVSISANKSSYRSGETVTFTANGSDPDGTDRIEVFVNGTRVRTCSGSRSCFVIIGPFTERSVTYAATVFGTDGTSTTTGTKTIERR